MQCESDRKQLELPDFLVMAVGAVAILLLVLAVPSAQAQTFTVLHSFSGPDGANPSAAPVLDAAGNLYGPTLAGTGAAYNGTIFKLANRGSGWILSSLYDFQGGNDGVNPRAAVTLDPSGVVYGSTTLGGGGDCTPGGCGTVFKLRPPATFCRSVICHWGETLYAIENRPDGAYPNSPVIFDQAGNVYGTTNEGGTGFGVVYQLTPAGDGWTENVAHVFLGGSDGAYPSGVVSDASGNLYGTTGTHGPDGYGTVFRLTYTGSAWTLTNLYAFHGTGDGGVPYGRLVLDQSGNLYGTTSMGGGGDDGGTIYELSPQNGSWTYTVLYSFPSAFTYPGGLVLDAAGNLYGEQEAGGSGSGSVFKLTRWEGGWTYSQLYAFTGGSDGSAPIDTVVLDHNGNLYGAAYYGGSDYCEHGCGTVWEITP